MTTGLYVRQMSGPDTGTLHEMQNQSATLAAQASVVTVGGEYWYRMDMTVADYKAQIAYNIMQALVEQPTSATIAFDLNLSTIVSNAAPIEANIFVVARVSDGGIYGKLVLVAGSDATHRKLRLYGLSGSGSSITTADLTQGTTYRIEAFWRGNGDLRMSLREDGAVVEASPTYNYAFGVAQPLNSYFHAGYLGGLMGGKAGNDADVVVDIHNFSLSTRDDGAGNWIGTAPVVKMIKPNADTAVEQWTLSAGADSYALVDEVPPNDDTDYLSVGNTSADDNKATELDMESSATGGITAPLAVMPKGWFKPGTVAAGADIEMGVDDNGTDSTTSLVGDLNISTSIYVMAPQVSNSAKPYDTRPSNGADWATADIDALKFRILRNTFYSGSSRRTMRLSHASIHVLDGAVGSALPSWVLPQTLMAAHRNVIPRPAAFTPTIPRPAFIGLFAAAAPPATDTFTPAFMVG